MVVRLYLLIDPVTEEIRYVGRTFRTLPQRLRNHLRERGAYHKARWIQALRRKGLKPRITLIQEVPLNCWVKAEQYWIGFYRALGCPLTNSTLGGDGNLGNTMSEAAREKLRQAALRRYADPIQGALLRSQYGFQPGFKPSVGHRTAMSNAGKKRWAEATTEQRESHRKSVSLKVKGRAKSQEHKDKLSASLKAKPKSEETRQKMSVARMGKTLSPSVRAKISETMKALRAAKKNAGP